MEAVELRRVAETLAKSRPQLLSLPRRPEARERSKQYVRGLLVERGSSEVRRTWPGSSHSYI